MLTHEDRLLDLGLFDVSLFPHLVDARTILRGHHLIVLHLFHLLLDFLIVSLLEFHDLSGTFASLFNLFTRLLLLLFEQCDTIGEKLGVTLDTIKTEKKDRMGPQRVSSESQQYNM